MTFTPLFFERNRVERVYTGGKLFYGFFGDENTDGFFPEEWIASSVKALNKAAKNGREGVSRVRGTNLYFDDLLKRYPTAMLGSRKKMRILVKVLDSAVRLPAQAHPDKAFSRRFFHSEYGKTESWLVLDTRPEARIYFGFRDGVDEQTFSDAIDASETDKNAIVPLMKALTPSPGDVFLVPAKTVHAIGAGCLILEIQEPTDFTIQPEHWCDDYHLDDAEMYLGLTKAEALQCFHFGKVPEARRTPIVVSEKEGVRLEHLISERDTDCFIVNRITLSEGGYRLFVPDSYGVYVVTRGKGALIGEGYEQCLAKGDYFFIPACCMGDFSVMGSLELVECY